MKKDEVPSMRAIKLEDDMTKFKPELPDLTVDNVRKFVSDFVEGKVKVLFFIIYITYKNFIIITKNNILF